VFGEFVRRAGLPQRAAMLDVVESIHQMPYGRPATRSAAGALAQWRGTCSTKHALLAAVLAERWPQTCPRLVHRVYRCTPESAAATFGPGAAAAVPAGGLWDVHRYLTAQMTGGRLVLDITFPWSTAWDGVTSMPVMCGPGTDHEVPPGAEADAHKRALEAAHCDPRVREPFIAALSQP
jgi:hypothetical protein